MKPSVSGLIASAATAGAAISVAALINTAINVRRLPHLEPARDLDRTADVVALVPMRNEAGNAQRCVEALATRSGAAQVTVLDDASTDTTRSVLAELQAQYPLLKVIDSAGDSVPDNWIGKNWACIRLAEATESTWLAFIDADVAVTPGALTSAVDFAEANDLDMLCPYPEQLTSTPLTRLIQPLLQWSWLAFIPMGISQSRQVPSMAVGNGQFLVARRAAYEAVGGHAAVAHSVVEDMALARLFRECGFRTAVIDGSNVAACRMYTTDEELIGGYAKSLATGLGGQKRALVTAGALKLAYVIPPLAMLFGHGRTRAMGAIGYASGVASRGLVAKSTNQRVWPEIAAQPVSVVAFSALTTYSIRRLQRGDITWKGRRITPGQTRKPQFASYPSPASPASPATPA